MSAGLALSWCSLVLGAQRPAQPPSWPSALPVGRETPLHTRHAATPLEHEFVAEQGFIGAGNDVATPEWMEPREALIRCDALPRCRGITYHSTSNASAVQAYFKLDGSVKKAHGWSSWVKVGRVGPPAARLAVGGRSGLQLLLRDQYFTVQNLSIPGENWSFTRPLEAGRYALPSCTLLGDLTLRLRALPAAAAGWSTFSTTQLAAPAEPIELPPLHASSAAGSTVLAAQDITNTLARSSSVPFPLRVVRSYERSADGAALLLRFNLSNSASVPVEVGGLGFALPESPVNQPGGLESVVWADPHIGGDYGWVEMVRVVKDQATLLITPAADARGASAFEGWRPMLEDLGRGDSYEWLSYSKAWAEEWAHNRQSPFLNMSASLRARYPPFAQEPETPWPSADGKHAMPSSSAAATPWNAPRSLVLAPGESRSLALQLQRSPAGPRSRDATLAASGAAVLRAVPGYVIASDMRNATLFVRPPRGQVVVSADAQSVGIFSHSVRLRVWRRGRTAGGEEVFSLRAQGRGRARVSVRFSDGSAAIAHYLLLPPFAEQVHKLGQHLAHTAWLPRDYPDPFGRGASVMPWDRSTQSHVLDDARAYNVGLSDDAGAGNPLALASKVRAAPQQDEVARVDEYIEFTLYGVKPDTAAPPLKSLQIREGEEGQVDGIRMTLYYYADDLNSNNSGHFPYAYTEADKCHEPFGGPTWCMNEHMSNMTYRGFNFPHQIASYWAMYTVARHHAGLQTRMSWQWYLTRAVKTALLLGSAGVGFMDGTVLRELLAVLQEEAQAEAEAAEVADEAEAAEEAEEALAVLQEEAAEAAETAEAADAAEAAEEVEADGAASAAGAFGGESFGAFAAALDANMRRRQAGWARTAYPYGSEFAFDTTGQEEIVIWSLWYGDEATAKRTVDHILSYMRSSPTWAYHGGSRSWGDVENNGKYLASFGTGCDDRGQMHYRSGLNMIPLLEWYRAHPDDLFVLEVAMGSISGQMANIDQSGAPSMMFHALPHVMDWDPHSGDFGLGFFGNALQSGAYFVRAEARGDLCFLCDVEALEQTPRSPKVPSPSAASPAALAGGAGFAIVPRDAYRRQAFLEPLALLIKIDCGQIARLLYTPASRRLVVRFTAHASCRAVRLRLSQTSKDRPTSNFRVEGGRVVRGAHELLHTSSEAPVQMVVLWDQEQAHTRGEAY